MNYRYKFCKEKANSSDDRRLVGYAKRLEEELYQRASSLVCIAPAYNCVGIRVVRSIAFGLQEQYQDVETLYLRLTEAARIIQQRNGPAEPHNGSVAAAPRHPGTLPRFFNKGAKIFACSFT